MAEQISDDGGADETSATRDQNLHPQNSLEKTRQDLRACLSQAAGLARIRAGRGVVNPTGRPDSHLCDAVGLFFDRVTNPVPV
jgi:hypothetical protein